jgi:polar amino acid transport system substrate-binding protein
MRKVLAAAQLLVLVAGSAVLAAAPKSLNLVSTAWPPFTNGGGQPRFALDLVEAALGRMHMPSRTTIVSPSDFSAKLLSGDFDGSAAAWRDPMRELVLLYSRPYLENRLVLVSRRGADVSAAALTALKGRKIAIVEGYSYGEAVEASGAIWVRTETEEDSLSRLLKGDVDATLMDELVVRYIAAAYPAETGARLEIGTTPLITRELCLAISRTRHDAESIINGFNTQIRSMIKDRTYHRLLNLDWITVDVNGDGVPDFVPASDRPGPAAPVRAYTLFSLPSRLTPSGKTDFYIGGNTYDDWASVPEQYKRGEPAERDPRVTTPLFKFVW